MGPITDMLNRIKNAQAAKHEVAYVPYSRLKWELAKILEKEKFVKSIERHGRAVKKTIEITLFYEDGASKIHGAKRISKPGQRRYSAGRDLPMRPSFGMGIVIVSTSKGLMTSHEAKKKHLGGELLCEIW